MKEIVNENTSKTNPEEECLNEIKSIIINTINSNVDSEKGSVDLFESSNKDKDGHSGILLKYTKKVENPNRFSQKKYFISVTTNNRYTTISIFDVTFDVPVVLFTTTTQNPMAKMNKYFPSIIMSLQGIRKKY